MSLGKQLIQKEIDRLKRGISGRQGHIKNLEDLSSSKSPKKVEKDELKIAVKNSKIYIKESETAIKELEADLKKL